MQAYQIMAALQEGRGIWGEYAELEAHGNRIFDAGYPAKRAKELEALEIAIESALDALSEDECEAIASALLEIAEIYQDEAAQCRAYGNNPARSERMARRYMGIYAEWKRLAA